MRFYFLTLVCYLSIEFKIQKMKNQLLSLCLLVSVASFAQGTKTTKPAAAKQSVLDDIAANAIKYPDNGKEDEITVDGKDIVVSGNENRLTFKGTIRKIIITGKNNDILIESVKQIIVPGNGNFVSWEKSENTGGKPVIVDKGGYNNVERRSDNAQDRSDN